MGGMPILESGRSYVPAFSVKLAKLSQFSHLKIGDDTYLPCEVLEADEAVKPFIIALITELPMATLKLDILGRVCKP